MKIIDIINAKNTILEFSNEKVPIKLAYKFHKFIESVKPNEEFYNSKRDELIQTYCEKDDEGNFVQTETGLKIVDGKQVECFNERKKLEELEVAEPDIKFTVDELKDLKLSLMNMIALSAFIEE